jgi:hypothetical protein
MQKPPGITPRRLVNQHSQRTWSRAGVCIEKGIYMLTSLRQSRLGPTSNTSPPLDCGGTNQNERTIAI